MIDHEKRLPDIFVYTDLIDRFIENSITASEFESAFLRAIKQEQRILGNPVYPILQELFEDTDAYVSDPSLRTEPEDLDDEQLRACARRARQALRVVGYL
ncbi:colicin immunity domain-containing protein [Mycolicibacterium litorale]|uniref:colicin immunity domain-containing protein n=1 Tax=Mycolicibacterium litorale TaxID=758802 RepID=UPI0039A3DFAA